MKVSYRISAEPTSGDRRTQPIRHPRAVFFQNICQVVERYWLANNTIRGMPEVIRIRGGDELLAVDARKVLDEEAPDAILVLFSANVLRPLWVVVFVPALKREPAELLHLLHQVAVQPIEMALRVDRAALFVAK